ncbi:LmeA family phospholipid-binding protein [Microbacterium sp.]|uniref:LmeA family phospholipid-binding protein n=1 Tax=Microbacterium sp. TaxID=51671 RepID=UPI002C0EFF2A|nr:LmeA family phospholipid-binding protein [Microbacterium sp.]HWL77336.1 LmeA family phospholipid-binding protein [Microbacterium sp.]
MTTPDGHPTLPLPGSPARDLRRRRRVWPWIVTIIVVVGLAVAAFFVAEAIVRDLVTKTIRDQITTRTGIDASNADVQVPGLVLPQLAAGTFDSLTISGEDVVFRSFSGDIHVEAHGVPVRGDGDLTDATATVTLDEPQLQALMSGVQGFPADSIGLAAPNVTMSTELSLFGGTFPVAVALTPSAEQAQLVLSPAEFEISGSTVSADRLRDQFGVLADVLLRDWRVCIADRLPAGVTLSEVGVEAETLVADFEIAPGIVHDTALQSPGTCA